MKSQMSPLIVLLLFNEMVYYLYADSPFEDDCPKNLVGSCSFECKKGDCDVGQRCCRTNCKGSVCVNENGQVACPPDKPRVICLVPPCDVSTCPKFSKDVTCIDDMCGGCFARYYIGRNLVNCDE